MMRRITWASSCIGAACCVLIACANPRAETTPPTATHPSAAPAAPPAPAGSTSTPLPTAQPAAPAQVLGFRSARFGMSEAEVRDAITKDFGVGADAVRTSQNPSERTQILSVKVPDVLPDGGTADVSYVFGYRTRKLIQVGVAWSKATDDKLTAERLVANGDSLREYFLSQGYKADTIATNAAVANGLMLFRGSDADGHTTVLLLQGTMATDKAQHTLTPSGLLLFYLADPKNADVYRIPAGKF